MHEHWEHKKQALRRHVEPADRSMVRFAMDNGAIGGKLIGAGRRWLPDVLCGGQVRLRHAMARGRLAEVRFRFDFEGTKVVAQ